MPGTSSGHWIELLISVPPAPPGDAARFRERVNVLLEEIRKLVEAALPNVAVVIRHSFDSRDGQFHIDLVFSPGCPGTSAVAGTVRHAFASALSEFNKVA